MPVSVVYEFIVCCRLIARLRGEYSCCRTLFVQVEQI